ncbi:MAG TPA: glycosyltransferase family 87 protein [Candidatus Dormibacteraeota bacterium]
MTRSRRALLGGLAALLVLSASLHVALLLTTTGASADLDNYHSQAFAVTHAVNVYRFVPNGYPYPPVWIWIMWLLAGLSHHGVPFAIAVKLPATVADLGIIVLLFWHEVRLHGWQSGALAAAALWALNPIAAVIAAGHGQFDAVPIFFMVLAVLLIARGDMRSRMLASLALGLAIALKGYPVVLLPYLVFTTPRGRRLAATGLALAPVLAAMAVYVLAAGFSPAMITHVVGYQSVQDLGLSAVLHNFTPITLSRTGQLVLTVVAADLFVFWALTQSRLHPSRAELGAAALFAMFYLVTPRGSIQYLVWGLPFFVLAFRRLALAFTIAGTALMVGFYSLIFSGALPGNVSALPGGQWFYLLGLVGVLVVSAGCVVESWRRREGAQAAGATLARKSGYAFSPNQ